jgi:ketosteroid isomerase-like protein
MGKSDPDTAAKCLTPDATTLAKGFGKFAGIRHYDRIIGTIAAFKQLVPSGMSPIIHTITAEETRVTVEFEGEATLANGASYCNQYCMVFTLLDGKIKHANEYFSTKLADEVVYRGGVRAPTGRWKIVVVHVSWPRDPRVDRSEEY